MPTHPTHAVPLVSPHYPPPPYRYRDCPLMVVPFVAAAGVTRRLVPEPLAPAAGDVAFVAIGHLHNDRLGSTREAFLVVPVTDGTRQGNYTVLLYLENDACVTSGREIWGWPKKLATVDFRESADAVAASVRRRGTTILSASLTGLVEAQAAELDLSPVWFNLKVIPSVAADAPPEVAQVTATTFAGLEARDVRRGAGAIAFGDGPDDRLAGLVEVAEVLPGHRMTLAFDLVHGEVVHDYLSAGAGAAEGPRVLAVR